MNDPKATKEDAKPYVEWVADDFTRRVFRAVGHNWKIAELRNVAGEILGYETYDADGPANLGIRWQTFDEAREHLQAWVRNTSDHRIEYLRKLMEVEL